MPDSSASNVDVLAANLAAVRQRIDQAATRSGRDGDQVTLVGVCKYVGTGMTSQLLQAGCGQLAENRPQQLWEKTSQMEGARVEWHLIGHLQRNKVRRTLPLISLLHSGDSMRLLQAVNEEASRLGQALPLLLEVNVSGDQNKHGFQPGEMTAVLEQVSQLDFLAVNGLMTMASLEGGPGEARRDFSSLRELRDDLRRNCPDNVRLGELSMGMSGDFEVAIEEGATLVRVGSALFEGIEIPGR